MMSSAARLLEFHDDTLAFARALFTRVGMIAFRVDSMRVHKATDLANSLFGYDTLEGLHVEDLIPPPLRERHQALVDKFLKAPRTHLLGGPGRKVDGWHKEGRIVDVNVAVLVVSEFQGVPCVIAEIIPEGELP